MKTLRELLLERHRSAEPKLDAVRQCVVANLPGAAAQSGRNASTAISNAWREFLPSLRWHLAGLAAAWIVVLLLNFDRSSAPTPKLVAQTTLPARKLLAAVLENRRQLRELMQTTGEEQPALLPQPSVPQRRSEVHSATALQFA